MARTQEAIVVRNAIKRYGKNKPVLDGLSMIVPQGCIYGLLGASGCGKTTLLSCIVGIKKLDAGEVWVLGGRPGAKGSSIPGPRVGFMPQEISLVQEFTVLGAFFYFGRINGMDDDKIMERHSFLSKLLQLPDPDRLIKHMSGGQQRRVSFGCALIHEPDLLVLDEPTVGLDPILRENIWDFLFKITKQNNVTVIITTHYIDETKLADKIGLLRKGLLLAETSPSALMEECRTDSLEEAFLQLSQKQQERTDKGGRIIDSTGEYLPELGEISNETLNQNYNIPSRQYDEYGRSVYKRRTVKTSRKFQALMTKNLLQFLRHPIGILFAFIFPLIQINAFFNTIGGDPKDLEIAVINHETMNCNVNDYTGQVIYSPEDRTCEFIDVSCRFLNAFNNFVDNVKYDNFGKAIKAVKKGDVVGAIFVGKNFSKSLRDRIDYYIPEDLTGGDIEVTLDMSDHHIGTWLEKNLRDKFAQIYRDLLEECKLPRRLMNLPVNINEMFSKEDATYQDFVVPGCLNTLLFFIAASVSSAIIITDRHEGIWNRSLVQGVTTTEILLSHILSQLIIVVIQVGVTVIITFAQYDYEYHGSLGTIIFLLFLMGICGLCYGFVVSVFCTSHTVANYIVTGSFYPVVLLSGWLWPVEGMPDALQYISYIFIPTTIPILSLRSIIDKGYGWDESEVYQGFLVIMGWIAVFIGCALIGLKVTKN
ncbi:ABC transporter G family member 23-like [Chelonus insularis]|uniref:ABC transporter G family member 23-like n=1 Tax=Chelonus insularis TaxID=460826 RepID=UPI001589B0DE|nr:ABC transporter G family member 23-like [Chelonus insularis]